MMTQSLVLYLLKYSTLLQIRGTLTSVLSTTSQSNLLFTEHFNANVLMLQQITKHSTLLDAAKSDTLVL